MNDCYTAFDEEIASRELREAHVQSARARPQGDSETRATQELGLAADAMRNVHMRMTGQENECAFSHGDLETATEGRKMDTDTVQVYTHLHDLISEPGRESYNDTRTLSFVFWFRLANALFVLGSLFYVGQGISHVIGAHNPDDDADDDYEHNESWWNDSVGNTLGTLGALAYVLNAMVDVWATTAEIQGNVFEDNSSWEIGVGCTFGLAAILDLIGELLWDNDKPGPGYAAGSAAVHIYLVNAVLTISGRIPTFSSLPRSMMSAGDILFLVGSVIDVLISYVDNPNTPPLWFKYIAWSALFSSGLWFLDSILYVLANHFETDESAIGDDNNVDFDFGSAISSNSESLFLSCESITIMERKLEVL